MLLFAVPIRQVPFRMLVNNCLSIVCCKEPNFFYLIIMNEPPLEDADSVLPSDKVTLDTASPPSV